MSYYVPISSSDKAYKKVGADFVGLRDLSESLVDSKQPCCPDCRGIIQSVKRYGRITSFHALRFLERKHIMVIESRLVSYTRVLNEDGANGDRLDMLIEKLVELENMIQTGPMKKIHEACNGLDVNVVSPPSRPLLQTMRLRASCFSKKVKENNDDFYRESVKVYQEAILFADSDRSRYLASLVRLELCKFLLRWNAPERVKSSVMSTLQIVIDANINPEVTAQAIELREQCNRNELKEVIQAMNVIGGYNYGGSWQAHWYQCPNGHPYFIGECGGAMQTSRCIECGETVGGRGHSLHRTNRGVGGLVGDILSRGS